MAKRVVQVVIGVIFFYLSGDLALRSNRTLV